MKKLCALIALFLGALLLMGSGLAQTQAEKKGKTTEQNTVKAEPAKQLRLMGKIISVDKAAKTLMVKDKDKTMTFTVTDKILTELAEMKAGDKVTVRYAEAEGKLVARSVRLLKAEAKMEPGPKKK